MFLAALLCAIGSPALAADPADTILVNGKIVTVDERFTIAQGVAIRGQRIVAVGNNADVLELQGGGTKVIDLRKQTVIPGLIDNHAHFIRAPEHDELRLDGVASRKRALEMLTARVRSARPGEWIVTLGGWSEEQFTDDPRGFPLDELDRIAPDNPVVLQAVYNQSYLNSVALKAAGIDAATPDPRAAARTRGRPATSSCGIRTKTHPTEPSQREYMADCWRAYSRFSGPSKPLYRVLFASPLFRRLLAGDTDTNYLSRHRRILGNASAKSPA